MMACVLQEKPIRVKAEQGLVNEAQAAKVRKPLHNVMDSPGLSQQETNKRHCERCGQGAELQLLHNATQQALAQSQAHVGRLSNALLTAGCSNQADRLQMGKLHSTLGAQIVELEHASARAIELEHTLQTERLNHNATREALVDEKGRLEDAIREVQHLRNIQKGSDRVLRALRETNDASDKPSLANLVDQAMQEARKEFHDETAMEKIERNQLWQERQLLFEHRAAALDARERALEEREKLSYAPPSFLAGLVGFQRQRREL
jgi:hypothetical protein